MYLRSASVALEVKTVTYFYGHYKIKMIDLYAVIIW